MPIPATARLMEFPSGAILVGANAGRETASPLPMRSPEEAYAAGHSDGVAEGRAAAGHDAEAALRVALDDATAAAALHLAAERDAWAKEEGAALAANLSAGLANLAAEIGDDVAAILAPFLEAALRRRAVEGLRDALMPLLSGGSGPALRVSGPADLVDALRGSLGAYAASMVVESGGSAEVRVVADRTMIETRLATWGERLRGEGA